MIPELDLMLERGTKRFEVPRGMTSALRLLIKGKGKTKAMRDSNWIPRVGYATADSVIGGESVVSYDRR